MTLSVIVQARYGAHRLPGKLLHPLGSKSALVRTLDRCADIAGAERVICALPEGGADDLLEATAAHAGYRVVRGAEQDVLARCAKAARESGAEEVVLIGADQVFLDPGLIRRLIDLRRETGADYASNTMPARFPEGLDGEVFTADLLGQAEREAQTLELRSRPGAWMRRASGIERAALVGPGGGLEFLRWRLGHLADLAFFQAVYDELGAPAASRANAAELVALCLRRPDLVRINARHVNPGRSNCDDRAEHETAPIALLAAA